LTRGSTSKGRARAERIVLPPARPLVKGEDHGAPIRVSAATVGASGERWIDPFLTANAAALRRLAITPEVSTVGGAHLRLHPGAHIGAVPLLAPRTQRIVAGLLIEPRFKWPALGAVFAAIGFSAEPRLGGAGLVPGSAREVPAWMLAAPVLRRLEGLLAHRRRGFVERSESRSSPRGRVDWGAWARRDVPTGRWTTLPCTFTEPADDPVLMAAVRWTLDRIAGELDLLPDAPAARALRERVYVLTSAVGPGALRRPDATLAGAENAWIADALQAMGWVAEERGMGGAQSLDGLAWDLAVDQVWEAWVARFLADLAPRIGLTVRGNLRHGLNWQGHVASMGSLVPDAALIGANRALWVDAKYKSHLSDLARFGWKGLSEIAQERHRADLHQALAYATLANVDQVDTVLAYPHLGDALTRPPVAIATVASGRRRVRLVLAGLPFGFRSPEVRERALEGWREWLGGGPESIPA
jgi:hypothetical protein